MLLRDIICCLTWLALTAVAQNRQNSGLFADRVEYQTFELDGDIQDMMWCGQNDESILV